MNECIDANPDVRPKFSEIVLRLQRLVKMDVDIEPILEYGRRLKAQDGMEEDPLIPQPERIASIN